MLDDSFSRPVSHRLAAHLFFLLLCAAGTLLLGSSSQLHLPSDVTEQRQHLGMCHLTGACDQRNILRSHSISPVPLPCHSGTCHLRVRWSEVSMVGGSGEEDLCTPYTRDLCTGMAGEFSILLGFSGIAKPSKAATTSQTGN